MNPEDLATSPPARLPFPVTRAMAAPVECRSLGDGMPTMVGHFSTFGDWYEVDSWIEGRFLERIKAGAFRKTIKESQASMKVLYDHGQDPHIGNKVLGPIESLTEDKTGPAYEVPLFDTSYNRDLRPGLEAGVYGSSFRFSVEKDQWDREPEASDYNAEGLPERTITEARVFEFGPVTFPANPNATAGIRSTTDDFYQHALRSDPGRFDALLRSAQSARTPQGAAPPPVEPPPDTPEEPSEADTPQAAEAPPEPEPPAPVEAAAKTPARKAPPISEDDFLAQLQEFNRERTAHP
jgi:HK97 family phage prohead protease